MNVPAYLIRFFSNPLYFILIVIIYVILFLILLIFYLVGYFNLKELLIDYAIVFISIVVITGTVFKFKDKYDSYDSAMYFYLIGIILTLTFTVLLLIVLLTHPEFYYFNVLYILLGTLLVSFIDKILSRKEVEKKIFRKSQRIILAAINDITLNRSIAEANLIKLEHPIKHASSLELDTLNTNFWDLISLNIADVEIKNDLFQNFLSLKNEIDYINSIIHKRKLTIERSSDVTKDEKDAYDAQITQITIDLEAVMNQFLINSKLLKERVEHLCLINT